MELRSVPELPSRGHPVPRWRTRFRHRAGCPLAVAATALISAAFASPDELFEEFAALAEGAFAVGERALIRPVFHLDAHRAVVARIRERREELAPLHVAQSRQL